MKSTTAILALAIVLLAGITNHGCELAAPPLRAGYRADTLLRRGTAEERAAGDRANAPTKYGGPAEERAASPDSVLEEDRKKRKSQRRNPTKGNKKY